MDTEFEATFVDINKDEIRAKLREVGAILIKPEFLQKRVVFHPPENLGLGKTWARVRDEQDKITLSIKSVLGSNIEDQKELMLTVDSFANASDLLELLGCKKKAYQESKRELWQLDGCDITIDEWPFLEPFVEVEGLSEEIVKSASNKLGFDFSGAFFGSVDTLYSRKYNIPEEKINNQTPELKFDGICPFV